MIESRALNDPSPHVNRRARKCKVKPISPFSFDVTPPEEGKAVRRVHFDYDQDTGVARIDCADRETHETCGANEFSKPCAHALAASLRLLKEAAKLNIKPDGKKHRAIQKYARRVTRERLPGVSP